MRLILTCLLSVLFVYRTTAQSRQSEYSRSGSHGNRSDPRTDSRRDGSGTRLNIRITDSKSHKNDRSWNLLDPNPGFLRVGSGSGFSQCLDPDPDLNQDLQLDRQYWWNQRDRWPDGFAPRLLKITVSKYLLILICEHIPIYYNVNLW